MNAHLVLNRTTGDAIGFDRTTIGFHLELRDDKQRDAFGALRRTRQTRQYNVDDVVSEVVLTGGNKDLSARDTVAAIIVGLSFGFHLSKVCTALWFGQTHGAGPAALG